MDLREYVRMLRRGWLTIAIVAVLGLALATLYLVAVPTRYEASTVLFVSTSQPSSVDDLQQGNQFSQTAVITYAQVIDSATVLAPVATQLRPQRDVDDLVGMVSANVREETTLIDVGVSGEDPAEVATIANATADAATRIIPALLVSPDGRPLVRIQQIRPAVEPTSAASPDVARILAIGLVVGLFLGIGGTISRQTLDTRLRRGDDLRELTEVPLLAVLPQSVRSPSAVPATLRRGRRSPPLVVRDDPSSPAGEAFRTLRTNLRFLEAREHRSLVVAAVSDDHDGAGVAANLSWSLAQAGRSVLLIDLDLRRSSVGDAVGIEAGAGVADVLTGQVELGRVVHGTKHPFLRVMLSGTPQPNPSDLLSAPAMTGVLRRVEREHDYVILHAPPLLASADAAVASAAAGGAIVSVSSGRTHAHELTTALGALAHVRVEPLGLVMTGARAAGGAGRAGGGPRPEPLIMDTPTLQQQQLAVPESLRAPRPRTARTGSSSARARHGSRASAPSTPSRGTARAASSGSTGSGSSGDSA